MSRYIDADALMERFAEMQKVKPDKDGREYACNFRNMGGEPSVEWFVVEDAVENAPTVDAVPVVRCEKCRHGIKNHGISDGWVLCTKPYVTDTVGAMMHRADWFCADGERRTDDKLQKSH